MEFYFIFFMFESFRPIFFSFHFFFPFHLFFLVPFPFGATIPVILVLLFSACFSPFIVIICIACVDFGLFYCV